MSKTNKEVIMEKHNILICDDEKDIVSSMKIYLSGENVRVFEACNGQEALDIVSVFNK